MASVRTFKAKKHDNHYNTLKTISDSLLKYAGSVKVEVDEPGTQNSLEIVLLTLVTIRQ
jgi:hypothetical protein